MTRLLIYRSTVRGFRDEDLDADPKYPYFGFVKRIPKDSPPRLTEAVCEDLDALAQPQLVHGFVGEPVPGEPFERLEVYDLDSDDVLVMYRVPFRPVQPS
jgi:hypothetical protein